MGEVVAVFVIGAVAGYLLGGATAYDKGWNAGVSWARNKWSGLT